MPKIQVEILTAAECESRSSGTDAFTEGWWYHGTTYNTAKAILSQKKQIRGEFWLTKNPEGASQCNGKTALRCTVYLHKSHPPKPTDDKYNRKDADEGLDQPHKWIGIIEGKVFIDKDSVGAGSPSSVSADIPTVGEELARLMKDKHPK
jgi:hypothetical protein